MAARRRLCAALRSHREQAHLTQAEVAEALEWSLSKVQRVEAGTNAITVTDLKALLRLLDVTDPSTVGELVALAREAKSTGWWHQYRQPLGRHRTNLLAHEACCSRLRVWADMHIPDLLQTADYACRHNTDQDSDSLRLAEEIRTHRHRLVTDTVGPPMTFLIDESVLWRGSPNVLDPQLAALAETAKQPHIAIHIVPLDSGAPVGVVGGPFTILDMDEAEDIRIGFVADSLGNPHSRPDPQDVIGYIKIFDLLMTKATDPPRTLDYIQHVRRRLTRGSGRYARCRTDQPSK